MPFDDPTTNFGWSLPDNGADEDTWGDGDPEGLDAIFAEIDADAKVVDDEAAALATDVGSLEGRIQALESGQFLPVYANLEMVGGFQTPPAATPTALDFTTSLVVDSQEMFSSSTPTRLTIPDGIDGPLSGGGVFNLAGLYRLRAIVQVPTKYGSDNGRQWSIAIRKNGTDTIATRRWPGLNDGHSDSSGPLTLEVVVMDVGSVDDYYEVVVTTDSAGTIEGATFAAYRLPSPRPATARVLYSAGLDVHGNASADFERYTTANELSWAATGGKFGGGRMQSNASASGWTIRTLDVAQIGGKIAWYGQMAFDSGTGTDGLLRIMSGGGAGTLQFRLHLRKDEDDLRLIDSTGAVLATWDATPIIGTSSSPGPIHHFEIEWMQDTGGAGTVTVYIDGAAVITVTNLDTPNADWDTLILRGPTTGFLAGGDWYRRDDIVIQDHIGRLIGDGHRVWTVLPDSDAGLNEWGVSSGSDHSAMVDDAVPDGDTTAVSTNTDGLREEFGFTLPAITGTIREVVVHALSRSGDITAGDLRLGLRHNGVESLSAAITVPVDGQAYHEQMFSLAGPPEGGLWTVAKLEDAVLILEKANAVSLNVTQVWLEVLTTA